MVALELEWVAEGGKESLSGLGFARRMWLVIGTAFRAAEARGGRVPRSGEASGAAHPPTFSALPISARLSLVDVDGLFLRGAPKIQEDT